MPEGGPYRSVREPPQPPTVELRAWIRAAFFVLLLPISWPVFAAYQAIGLARLTRRREGPTHDEATLVAHVARTVRATRWIEGVHTIASGFEEESWLELELDDGTTLFGAERSALVRDALVRAGVAVRERQHTHGGVGAAFVWTVWFALLALIVLVARLLR